MENDIIKTKTHNVWYHNLRGIYIVGVCISFSLNDWIVYLNVIDKDPIIINTYMVKEFNKHEK